MRLFFIFLISAALLAGCVHNPPVAKIDTFGEKLTKFRYSLYKDLKGMDMEALNTLMGDGFSGHAVGVRCKTFYNENREQIRVYQRAILSKFSGTELDLTDVVRDERFNGILKDGPISALGVMEKMIESGDMKEEGKRAYTVFKFMSIDPLRRVNFIIPMLVSHLFSVQEVAARSLKNNLGATLIATKEIRPDYWEIIFDQYERVFYFDFDIKQDILWLKKVGKRQ